MTSWSWFDRDVSDIGMWSEIMPHGAERARVSSEEPHILCPNSHTVRSPSPHTLCHSQGITKLFDCNKQLCNKNRGYKCWPTSTKSSEALKRWLWTALLYSQIPVTPLDSSNIAYNGKNIACNSTTEVLIRSTEDKTMWTILFDCALLLEEHVSDRFATQLKRSKP